MTDSLVAYLSFYNEANSLSGVNDKVSQNICTEKKNTKNSCNPYLKNYK